MKTITVQKLYELSGTKPVEVIDVRSREEYRDLRTPLARHVPMDAIEPHELMRTRALPADEPVYFLCHVGGRSGWVCQAMMAAGYHNVVNVLGGTEAWVEAGLPIEQGDATTGQR